MEAAADQDLLCANQNLQVTAVLLQLCLMSKLLPEAAAQNKDAEQHTHLNLLLFTRCGSVPDKPVMQVYRGLAMASAAATW